MSTTKTNPAVIEDLKQHAGALGDGQPMTPRWVRLPPATDDAVEAVVAQVPGLNRSALIRRAVTLYLAGNCTTSRYTKRQRQTA